MLQTLAVVLSIMASTICMPLEDGEDCGYKGCPKYVENHLNIHIVPHTHDDVGWLKTVDQYYYGSRNNIQLAGVRYILDSVIEELWKNKNRRFMYVETAFFWKWWNQQSSETRNRVHTLVQQGRLQFVGGAWSMNDEAASHYQSTVDQFTWGLRKLNETFGPCHLPKVGWQIDPFGHSREFASLLAAMGYHGLFLGRIDYQDKKNRMANRAMEMLWRGDDDIGPKSDIFTSVLYNTYSPPPGFCFDVLCSDEPIVDDKSSPMYNVENRMADFLRKVTDMSQAYKHNSVLVTMGEDFNYQMAEMWFVNLDKLIKYGNEMAKERGYNITLYYSTPNCYLKAVKQFNPVLPIKQDDFFPYASDSTAYWTGYFTSRPTTKYLERQANNYLQVSKQLQVLAGIPDDGVDQLKSAEGVMQHHDAVTGTEKQHVAHDYERLVSEAVDGAMRVIRSAINKITTGDAGPTLLGCERCALNESSCKVSETKAKFIVTVYNPLGWEVLATPVRLPVTKGVYEVYDGEGKQVETQVLDIPDSVLKIPTRNSKATHEILFIAENLPALGYKSYYVKLQSKKIFKRHTSKSIEDRRLEEILKLNSYFDDIKKADYADLINTAEIKTGNAHVNKIQTEKSMDEANLSTDDATSSRIVELMVTEKSSENNNVNRLIEPDVNYDILKDNQYDSKNKDIEYFKKLALEARKNQFAQVARNVLLKEENGKKVQYPSLSDDEMRMLADDPVVEMYPDDTFVGNDHTRLRINNTTGRISHIMLSNGLETPFSINTFYYPGCVGNNVVPANRSSGAYIFRPNATTPFEFTQNDSKVSKGDIVEEFQYADASYVSGVIRIFKNKNIDFIEHEWLVGPIPIDDDVGKEVIVRYVTDVVNNGEFYTDSNGRQTLKRILSKRPQWNVSLEEPIAGNYYPVTNEIYIEDDKKRVTILTDRSQGGSSLVEGNIEVMLHRRLLHDDSFGVGEALNETAKGIGLVVQGEHRLIITDKSDQREYLKIKKNVLQFHLHPQIFFSDAEIIEFDDWLKLRNVHGSLRKSLPEGLHLLTLEFWNEAELLLRLENYLEKSDKKDTTIGIDISSIFNNVKIKAFKEVTLAGKEEMRDHKQWNWNTETEFNENFNRNYGTFEGSLMPANKITKPADDGFKIFVAPKEIRTFIINYELISS